MSTQVMQQKPTVLQEVERIVALGMPWREFVDIAIRANIDAQLPDGWEYSFSWAEYQNESGRTRRNLVVSAKKSGVSEEEAERRKGDIYEIITSMRAPELDREAYLFSARMLSEDAGAQADKKIDVLQGHTHTSSRTRADYDMAVGQGVQEWLRQRVREQSEVEVRDGMVWSRADFVGEAGYVIQVKTFEHLDRVTGRMIDQAGWETAVAEKQAGKHMDGIVLLLFRDPWTGTVAYKIHMLTDQEKRLGYQNIHMRSIEAAQKTGAWLRDHPGIAGKFRPMPAVQVRLQ